MKKNSKKEIKSKLLYDRVRSREDLLYFASLILPNYDWTGAHHRYICKILQNYDTQPDRPNSRMMMSLPPRSGKSTLAAQVYPAWVLMRDPSAEIVIASYTASLASAHLREVHRILTSDEYIRLLGYTQRDNTCISRNDCITTRYKGYIMSVGVGGSLNGRGATHMIIDDPIGSRADAESPTISSGLWNWYVWVAARRLAPQARIVIDHTRWCDSDLIGRILASSQAHDWQYVRIPAICDSPDDPLDRTPGESIWPSRWPATAYLAIEKEDHYAYTTMYQQIPISEATSYIRYEWLDIKDNSMYSKDLAKITIQDRYRIWDLAYSQAKSADYSATCVCSVATDGHIYISDIELLKMDYPDVKNKILNYAQAENIPTYMEANGPQAGIFSDIANSLLNNKLTLKKLDTTQSKNSRVLFLADEMKNKKVTIYTTAAYHQQTITQLVKYDGRPSSSASHDDITDVIAHAVSVAKKIIGTGKQSIYIATKKQEEAKWM